MESQTNNKPFIKKFKTKQHCYIYDVNSNELLRVNSIFYKIIDDVGSIEKNSIIKKWQNRYSISEIKKTIELIEKERRKNIYLSNSRPDITFGFNSINNISEILDSKLEHLILELTQRCNQRCKYCGFSGKYGFKRVHSHKDMDFDIAKKSIDFFIRNSEDSMREKSAISFYGGEPLLRFELIKQINEYLRNSSKNRAFRLSLSTNATLLNKEIIEYFAKNNVFMHISLDGPKEINDRYRVFANAEGTFDMIMENLNKIREYCSNYFKKYVGFNVVLAPPYDFQRIKNFFYKYPLFQPIITKIEFTFVDSYETSFFNDYNLEGYENSLGIEISELRHNFITALINNNYHSLNIEKKIFTKPLYHIAFRRMEPLGKKYAPQGTCYPGQRRLFVNVEGNFYMCERVNCNYKIGDVHNGFDYEKINCFYKEYERFFNDCKNCWALRFCMKCFNQVRKGENFNVQRKQLMCEKKLDVIEKNLRYFCEINERNPDAFKPFESIAIN